MANHQPEKPNQAISPGPARPSSATAMTVAVRTSLDAAVALAHAGDHRDARKLCAAVVFNMQPMIATSTELLRATLHALLLAHGFELLAREYRGSSGAASVADTFREFEASLSRLPADIRAEWTEQLRRDWLGPENGSILLLTRLEGLY